MKTKSHIFKDLVMVLSSNALILISSILTGLVVPKLMGVTNYSYYKIFTLYTSYTALLHFGFIDGILLKHGDNDYEDLNKEDFRTNSKFFILFQLIIAILCGILSCFMKNKAYAFILLALSVYMVLNNVTTYYQFISQATMRFKELSVRKVIQSSLTVISVIFLFFLKKSELQTKISYELYIIIVILISFLLAIWYVITYRDITFGKCTNIRLQWKNILNYFKGGISLTIAYQVSNLVFTIDSQYISILFSKVTYGMYAFAYSLIQMALTILNAVSTVLFPHIKRKSISEAMDFYTTSVTYVLIAVYAIMLGYFPIKIFIHIFLPEYIGSIIYFQILFPGVGVTCCLTLIIFNYFKILDKSNLYFLISLGVLIESIIGNYIAYKLFNTAYSIAFMSLITLFIWRLITEIYLSQNFGIHWVKNYIYTVIMAISFLLITGIDNLWISFFMYLSIFLAITIFCYRNFLKNAYYNWRK